MAGDGVVVRAKSVCVFVGTDRRAVDGGGVVVTGPSRLEMGVDGC